MCFKTYKLTSILLAASILPLSQVAAAAPKPRPPVQAVWARTELYFGMATPNGEVTDAAFADFIASYVTPRFPAGLTVLSGYGQSQNPGGTVVKEDSKVLILFYPVRDRSVNRRIQEIRSKYKEQFRQESVLRVDSYSVVMF